METNSKNIAALVQQGEDALVVSQWQAALTAFDRALEALRPASNNTLNIRRGPHAVTEVGPEVWAEAFNGRGVALLELGRSGEAVAAFGAAIELNPRLANAYFNRGMVLESQGEGRFVEALSDYDRAIELEPHDAEVYFRRGGLFFQYGDYTRAAADNTVVLEMHDASGQSEALIGPLMARGLCYYQQERLDDAIADYSRAVTLDPRGAVEAYFYRALVFIDQEQALAARADLGAFLNLTPDAGGEMAAQAHEIIKELDNL